MENFNRCFNEFMVLYPNHYKNSSPDFLKRLQDSWKLKYDGIDDIDFIQAIQKYERESDYPNPPTTKDILFLANKFKEDRLKQTGKQYKRCVMPEEEMANVFHEIMAKEKKSKEDWELLNRLKKYAEMYEKENGEYTKEADAKYFKRFGKTRTEQEKI